MFKNSKIKKKFINLKLIFFSIVIISYVLSVGQPFLPLYDNGFVSILLSVIKSESGVRIKELIYSLDDQYFKVMIGLLFFFFIIFFFLNSKKINFFKNFNDFFNLNEFKPEFLKVIYIS